MNVGQIKTEVKRTFGDESGVQVTDSDIVSWINACQRQIVLQNEGLLEKTAVANSVQGQADYSLSTLSSDILVFRGLMYKDTGQTAYFKLKGLSLNELNEVIDGWNGDSNALGTPQYYTVFENKISVYPVPSSSVTSAIKIFYTRQPVDIANDTDIPDLPLLYHDAIVNFCLMRAYELDENLQAASAKGQQVESDLKTLRGRDDWKQQETYPTITILWEDM